MPLEYNALFGVIMLLSVIGIAGSWHKDVYLGLLASMTTLGYFAINSQWDALEGIWLLFIMVGSFTLAAIGYSLISGDAQTGDNDA